MRVLFENDICCLEHTDILSQKRFLTGTRVFLREGFWIRGFFPEFFPVGDLDADGCYRYKLNSLEPPLTASGGQHLGHGLVPPEQMAAFSESVREFQSFLSGFGSSMMERLTAEEFTLPDPRVHPELYWVLHGSTSQCRFVILWGLESSTPDANLRLDALQKVLEQSFQREAEKTETQVGLFASSVDPTPELASDVTTPQPKSDPVRSTDVDTISHCSGAEPMESSSLCVSGEAPVQVGKSGKWSRGFTRILIPLVILLVAVVLLTECAIRYTGETITVETHTYTQRGAGFTLLPGEVILSPHGEEIRPQVLPAHAVIPAFPKPGRFVYTRVDGTGNREDMVFTYHHARGAQGMFPVASLFLDAVHINPSTSVTARLDHSFLPGTLQRPDLSISWGEEDARFVPLDEDLKVVSHQYPNSGNYRVTLLARSPKGTWSNDTVDLIVSDTGVESSNTAHAPVADARVRAVRDVADGVKVELDLSGSYSFGSRLVSFEISWGDDSPVKRVDAGRPFASHIYPSRVQRAVIEVRVIDSLGRQNDFPCNLELDFRAATFLQLDAFLNPLEETIQSQRWLGETHDELQLIETVYETSRSNRKRVVFELGASVPSLHHFLHSIEWVLKRDGETKQGFRDAAVLDLRLADGSYLLQVRALGPDENPIAIEHRFSVHAESQRSWVARVSDRIARDFSFLSVSRYFQSP